MSIKSLTFIKIFLIVLVLSFLSGCHGPQYTESEKRDMEGTGRSIMQEWLNEHMPGAGFLFTKNH